jgi:hypothetical protein
VLLIFSKLGMLLILCHISGYVPLLMCHLIVYLVERFHTCKVLRRHLAFDRFSVCNIFIVFSIVSYS